jgi:hypothetical protein
MYTLNDKTLFDNYEEAVKFFDITDTFLKVENNHGSLDKILNGGNVIKVIGLGKTFSPGRPAGNQQLISQRPFFIHALKPPHLFPVFYKDKRIEYMGMYKLKDYSKKMSPSGFLYFEFIFHRESKYYETQTI